MKKTLIITAAAVLSLSMVLCGCKKKQASSDVPVIIDQNAVEAESSSAVPGGDVLLGGWKINSQYVQTVSEEEAAIYEDGVSGLDGLSYEPVTVLATQVVSGTNYAFLVYGNEKEALESGQPGGYAIAVVWQDLNGSSTLMNLTKINPADLHVKETGDDLVGGWTAAEATSNSGIFPSENAQTSFQAATADLGKTFTPVVLLGSQLVSGNNYSAISRGSDGQLYMSLWYCDTQENASMTVHGVLDWEYYNP